MRPRTGSVSGGRFKRDQIEKSNNPLSNKDNMTNYEPTSRTNR